MHVARRHLIVALDLPSVADARRLVEQLDESCVFYKVGLELVLSGGGSHKSGREGGSQGTRHRHGAGAARAAARPFCARGRN